jgi:uncharacterized heparinase superfamily protein
MNCGMPLQDNDEWRSAARLTQAHSTVGIGSASSAAFAPGYSVDWPRSPPLLSGAEHVSVVRGQNDDGLTLTARHDGYRRSYGIDHQRIITLSEAGTLFGEDHLLIHSANRAHKMDDEYHVRFHLHPALEVILDASLHQATLRGPDSRRWAFISADAPIYVEESIIFATPDGGRRSLQLVMRGRFRDTAVMRWELRKV